MPRIAFILHGGIRRKDRLASAIRKAFEPGYPVGITKTNAPGDSWPLAVQALQDGYTHLISVGGDGSLNELINGMMEATADWPTERRDKIRVGTLPYGTGNDYLKSVGGPTTLEDMKSVIEADSYRQVDIGLAHFINAEGEPVQRHFINITDLGLGGSIAQKVSRYSRKWGRWLNYQRGILTTLPGYQRRPVVAKSDHLSYEGDIMSLVIAKGRYFAGGLGIAPHAEASDGHFALTIIGQVSLWDYFRHLGAIRNCQRIDHPQIVYARSPTLTVTSSEGPIPIDMDGDFVGFTPLKTEVKPAILSMLCLESR